MKNLFLINTYSQSKKLFFLFIAFILLQVFFTYKSVETIPFFNYGMYSAPSKVYDQYEVFEFIVNDEPINPLNLPMLAHNMIFKTTSRYQFLQKHQFEDPIVKTIKRRLHAAMLKGLMDRAISSISNSPNIENSFPFWMVRYLEKVMKLVVNDLQINLNVYEYDEHYHPKLVESHPILTYSKE